MRKEAPFADFEGRDSVVGVSWRSVIVFSFTILAWAIDIASTGGWIANAYLGEEKSLHK